MRKTNGLTTVFMILTGLIGTAFSENSLDPNDQKILNETKITVDQLKEEVLKAKTRLRQLEQAVLHGRINSAKASIIFENQAEGFFAFSSAEFFLDDQLIQKIDGEIKDRSKLKKENTVFDADLPKGEHVLRAKIQYRGNDASIFKLFSYFPDHKFNLETTARFQVDYGKTTLVRLTTLDRGYFEGDIKERLHLTHEISQDWDIEPPH